MEKMLHYRLSIVDVWNRIGPYINDEQGRRQTIMEECRERWIDNATNVSSPHRISRNQQQE